MLHGAPDGFWLNDFRTQDFQDHFNMVTIFGFPQHLNDYGQTITNMVVEAKQAGLVTALHSPYYPLVPDVHLDWLDADEMLDFFAEHLTPMKEELDFVDIWNEPFHDPTFDPAQLAEACDFCHEIGVMPRINEFDWFGNKWMFDQFWPKYRNFSRNYPKEFVVGIQGHSPPGCNVGKKALANRFRKIRTLGRPMHVTEAQRPSSGPMRRRDFITIIPGKEWNETKQLNSTRNFYNAAKEAGCDAFQYWELQDPTWPQAYYPESGLWKSDGTPKPALELFKL